MTNTASDTVSVNFFDIGERIWMLEAMGSALSSKAMFMACEKIAPEIAPTDEEVKNSELFMGPEGPVWNTNKDTSKNIDVPSVVIEGLKTSVFGPVPSNVRTINMIEKLNLWTVH